MKRKSYVGIPRKEIDRKCVPGSDFTFLDGELKYDNNVFRSLLIEAKQNKVAPELTSQYNIRIMSNETFDFVKQCDYIDLVDEANSLLKAKEYSNNHLEVLPSQMTFKNGEIYYNGYSFVDKRIKRIENVILNQIDKKYAIVKRNGGKFEFERKGDFIQLLHEIRNVAKQACSNIERKTIRKRRKEFLCNQSIIAVFKMIDSRNENGILTLEKSKVMDVDNSLSLAKDYSELKREISNRINREVGNVDYWEIRVSDSDWESIIQEESKKIFENVGEEIVVEFPYKYHLLRWQNRTVALLLKKGKLSDMFVGCRYLVFDKKHQLDGICFDDNNSKLLGDFGREYFKGYDLPMFSISENEVCTLKEIIDNIIFPNWNEYQDNIHVQLHKKMKDEVKNLKRGFLLVSGQNDGMPQELEIEGLKELCYFDKLYFFKENNNHYSDDVYCKYSSSNYCYLSVKKRDSFYNYIELMQSDSKKSFYHFKIKDGYINIALFWIWSYFSSSIENKRDDYRRYEYISKSFGILDMYKTSNYYIAKKLGEFEKTGYLK